MADLGLKADPEQINQWLAQAILDSQLGKTLKDLAQQALGKYDFRQQVERTLQAMVAEEARKLVENDPETRKAIEKALAELLTPELIARTVANATRNLHRDY